MTRSPPRRCRCPSLSFTSSHQQKLLFFPLIGTMRDGAETGQNTHAEERRGNGIEHRRGETARQRNGTQWRRRDDGSYCPCTSLDEASCYPRIALDEGGYYPCVGVDGGGYYPCIGLDDSIRSRCALSFVVFLHRHIFQSTLRSSEYQYQSQPFSRTQSSGYLGG